MSKRSLLLIALFLGLTVNAHAMTRNSHKTHSAPDRVNRFDWGIGAAASLNDGAEDSAYLSTAVAYGVTPYVAIGVEAGWQEADGDIASETISYIPVMADIILRLPTVSEAMVPYAVLGLGGANVNVERTSRAEVDDTGFAWKLGGGLDYFLNSNWIFNLEFAYWNIDVSLPGTSMTGDSATFWTLGAGIKYLF